MENTDRFEKYEADYACRLMEKYFSDKDIYGGNIHEEIVTVDDLTIRASRWPGTKSYADPASFFKLTRGGSTSATETPANNEESMKQTS